MTYQLPSLNALRAFEAAARHLSFKQAANELRVTPGAVSQQVKSLEDALGVCLFERLHKTLMLTEAGQRYLPVIRCAFRQISEATERLVPKHPVKVLTIGVQPSFAVKWLFPRLGRFREVHPEIEVRISTATDVSDLLQGRVDLLIRHGLGHHSGFRVDRIFMEERFPVCSPTLLEGTHPLRTPGNLRFHTLLHDELRDGWSVWLRAHGIEGVNETRGPSFTDDSLALQAAIESQGVALGRSLLVERDIEAGRLVRPFQMSISSEFAYYLLIPEGTAECPEVLAFRKWTLGEVNGTSVG